MHNYIVFTAILYILYIFLFFSFLIYCSMFHCSNRNIRVISECCKYTFVQYRTITFCFLLHTSITWDSSYAMSSKVCWQERFYFSIVRNLLKCYRMNINRRIVLIGISATDSKISCQTRFKLKVIKVRRPNNSSRLCVLGFSFREIYLYLLIF